MEILHDTLMLRTKNNRCGGIVYTDAFPNQQTCEPDPIKLVNEWTRKLLPDVKLIGYDEDIPTVWKPQKDIPAVYWRKNQR